MKFSNVTLKRNKQHIHSRIKIIHEIFFYVKGLVHRINWKYYLNFDKNERCIYWQKYQFSCVLLY